jgi:Tfp pilus assembly protein PilN
MINLLPSQAKKELEIERKTRIITILGSLFLIFLIFLGILLFSVKIYILSQIESQKTLVALESSYVDTPQVKELEKNITDANQKISSLILFYENQVDLTEVLEKISFLSPLNVYLADFNYQKEKNLITLEGFAETREDFLEFKKSLEAEKEFSNLYSPISNLVKPTDIDFYITFNLVEGQ